MPIHGGASGYGIRCPEMEQKILAMTQKHWNWSSIWWKVLCLDVRIIRLPRHGASLPIGIGVSCSADRQALAKITNEGVFLEQLETNPARFLPEIEENDSSNVVKIDLNRDEVCSFELTKHPVKTRLSLNGPLIVARDLAHSRLRERLNEV